jgi:hypothetical protein
MIPSPVRRILAAIAWVVLAALIALGGAGVVASMAHSPETAARPELTWEGDRAAEPGLDAATAELEQLASDVEALGTSARLALAQVVAGSLDGLDDSIAEGTLQLGAVGEQAAALEASIDAVPGMGEDAWLSVSEPIRDRYAELVATRGLTEGLEAEWTVLTGRALAASRLYALLVAHDEQTGEAARQGAAAHYAEALAALGESDATLAEALALRDGLASTTDVTTLDEWLDRVGAYDTALHTLYQTLVDADGRVTGAVRRAFAAEEDAREQLPEDTRGLVVIMAEIARGGLNQAVIAIEEARGELEAALEVQRRLQQPPALPG